MEFTDLLFLNSPVPRLEESIINVWNILVPKTHGGTD